MDNKSLGKLIRKHRKEKQMTQSQLAERVYVSTNAVSKWEMGKNSIDPQNLERVVEVLDIPRSLLSDELTGKSEAEIPLPVMDTALQSPPELPDSEIEKSNPAENCDFPAAKKIRCFFIASGVILAAGVFILFSIWLNNRESFVIRDEYFDEYEGQKAYYLITEYTGELTMENINEYADTIRKRYNKYFNEASLLVIMFVKSYDQNDILNFETADAITVLNPDFY